MARDSLVTAVLQELASLGISGEVAEGRKHRKVLFSERGHQRFYTCSRSQSDHRAIKNAKADIRRIVKFMRQQN